MSRRRWIGLLTAAALVVIGLGVAGIGPPLPSEQPAARALPGVRASSVEPLVQLGTDTPGDGQLAFLAVEPGGNLVVSDQKRNSILRFDPSGHLLSEWGPRLGPITLGQPAGVAVQSNAFYVVDRGTPRILRLDASGRLQDVIDLASFGTYGLNGLAIDSGGDLYVADTGRNRILVLSPAGQLVVQVGHSGTDLGGFTQPMMLAFGPDGWFAVADWENARIERWDATFTAADAWPTGFRPFGVAVDALGRIFVPDTERHHIQVYTPQGVALGDLGGAGATIDVAPRQLAMVPSGPSALYALGETGIERIGLENTAPPPQATAPVDLFSLALIGLLVALVLLAVLSRRGRRPRLASAGAPLERKVRLHSENGAQRQDQQPRADKDLLIANQAEGKRQPAGQHDQTENNREANHQR